MEAEACSVGGASDDLERISIALNHNDVVAGLVPATPSCFGTSTNNGGGRDKPGHDAGGGARRFNLNGIRRESRPDPTAPDAASLERSRTMQ
jgi:hypothetical protein